MPLARCKPGMRGFIILQGRPLLIVPGWVGALPVQALDGRYPFVEPFCLPLPPPEDEFVVFEENEE